MVAENYYVTLPKSAQEDIELYGAMHDGATKLPAPAWLVERPGNLHRITWNVPGADRYQLVELQSEGEPVVVGEQQGISDLAFPAAGEGEPRTVGYRVRAFSGRELLTTSSIGSGDGDKKADLWKYLRQWKKWREIAPQEPDSRELLGSPKKSPKDDWIRVEQKVKLVATPASLINPDPNERSLWPGNIIRSDKAVKDGLLQSCMISENHRTTLGISINNIGSGQGKQVEKPNYTNVMNAIKQAAKGQEGAPSSTVFKVVSGQTSTSVCLELGISAQFLKFGGKFDLSAARKEKKNTVVGFLREIMYDALCDVKPPNEYLNEKFTNTVLHELINKGFMGEKNPPSMVSGVIFGRTLMFSMTASHSEESLSAALEASFGLWKKVDAKAKTDYQAMVTGSSISVYASGVTSDNLKNIINSEKGILSIFDVKQTLDKYTVLGYTLHSLEDEALKMSEKTTFDAVTWRKPSRRLEIENVHNGNDGEWEGNLSLRGGSSGKILSDGKLSPQPSYSRKIPNQSENSYKYEFDEANVSYFSKMANKRIEYKGKGHIDVHSGYTGRLTGTLRIDDSSGKRLGDVGCTFVIKDLQ